MMVCLSLGWDTLKFFPANIAGGSQCSKKHIHRFSLKLSFAQQAEFSKEKLSRIFSFRQRYFCRRFMDPKGLKRIV